MKLGKLKSSIAEPRCQGQRCFWALGLQDQDFVYLILTAIASRRPVQSRGIRLIAASSERWIGHGVLRHLTDPVCPSSSSLSHTHQLAASSGHGVPPSYGQTESLADGHFGTRNNRVDCCSALRLGWPGLDSHTEAWETREAVQMDRDKAAGAGCQRRTRTGAKQ